MRSITHVLCLVLAVFAWVACARETPAPVKAKVFALAPDEYQGRHVSVEGHIKSVGPAGAFFVLEDDSGQILVATDALSQRFECGAGKVVRLTGSLRSVAALGGSAQKSPALYFSMDSLIDCRP